MLALHEILTSEPHEDIGPNIYENYFWLLDELLEIYPQVGVEVPHQEESYRRRLAALLGGQGTSAEDDKQKMRDYLSDDYPDCSQRLRNALITAIIRRDHSADDIIGMIERGERARLFGIRGIGRKSADYLMAGYERRTGQLVNPA